MRFLFILPLLISSFLYSQDDMDCIFDLETQTDEFIRDIPEYANYEWNDEYKEATIALVNSDTLIALRGGCIHFGISGRLISSNIEHSLTDIDFWYNEARKIAVNLFLEEDVKEMDKCYEEKKFNNMSGPNNVQLYFQSDFYDSFSLHVDKHNGKTTLSIGYYF